MKEYWNENENKPYPFSANKYYTAANGEVLPYDIICDLSLSIPDDIGQAGVSAITITPTLVSVAVSTATGEGLMTGTFAKSAIKPYVVYGLEPLSNYSSGIIVFGSGINNTGQWLFNPVLPLEKVYTYSSQYVKSLSKEGYSLNLTGIVELIGSDTLTIEKTGEHEITFGIVDGKEAEFLSPCDRAPNLDECGEPPIRSINGVVADSSGVIRIKVS